jgi:hypothetical protein
MVFLACGYKFATDVSFPKGVESIYITIFENPTSETGIENLVTAQFIDEFTRRRPDALVSSNNDADAILTGVISSIRIWTISRRGVDIPDERRVVLTVDLTLTSTDGKVLWRMAGLSSTSAYSINQTNELITQQNKQVAILALSEKLAEIAYDLLTSYDPVTGNF